ncbi:hypothetical protein MMYC01_201894 [Madurella mycetomatis]|uniref:Uncharacterized protein n=1 Tax=Madurella mycetomatis TaxID=100816 RepID=A0A175WAQ3_9PEZI|nr:hypothetical protein MMYC01_201894 [Madurella mycetomatis]
MTSFRVLDNEALHDVSKLANRVQLRLHKWDKLVVAYSRRYLSVATDNLPAMSGLAQVIADQQPGDEYLTGVWKGNLLKGLSWFPYKSRWLEIVGAEAWPPGPVDTGILSWLWRVAYHHWL